MREVVLEDAEERWPPLLDTLVLMVPVVGACEPAMDDAHAADSAGFRLDRPLGCHRGRARAHVVFVLRGETAWRIPLQDLPFRFHAGPEVHDQRSLRALFELG